MCSPSRGAPTHPATALAVIPSPRFIHRRGLKGSAEDGAVQLANKANTSRLDGDLHGGEVIGILLLKQVPLQFTAAAAAPPAGLYVYLDEAFATAGSSMQTVASPACNERRTAPPHRRPRCRPMAPPSSTARPSPRSNFCPR
jgi:hypothetical protein